MISTGLLTAISLTLSAWNPTGFRWNPGEFPIPYCITANGTRSSASSADQRQAVVNAIRAWRSAGAGHPDGIGALSCTTFDARASTQACRTGINLQDGQNNFFWESNWTQGSSTLGVTHYAARGGSCGTLNGPSGNINLNCTYDGDIEFNDATTTWSADGSGGTDITSIAVHEYGHFIGLGHCDSNGTCNRGRAVMYSSYPGGTVRVPFNDDVQGACALYPGTPGGVGYPCTASNQCTSNICINAGSNGYCTQVCGACPQGYACEANPSNPIQQICLRDDGTNKDLCELCSWGLPDACANNGMCLSGLPETNQGRCATPCPNPSATDGACPTDYTCVPVQNSGQYCVPKSSDCNDLSNFTELQLGQTCGGTPPCATGLTCIGICSQSCTSSPDNCPAGFVCETFSFQSGLQSYCAPPVGEGQNCDGIKACPSGPCLLANSGGHSICYQECTGDPAACNNAQTCTTYTISGRTVGLCDPPGVPPRIIDAGVPGNVDATIPGNMDANSNSCSCDINAGICDSLGGVQCTCDPDCGPGNPGADGGTGGGSNNGICSCDEFFYCEPGCDCDQECPCDCDETFDCDLNASQSECLCDPECYGGSSEPQKIQGGSGCQGTGCQTISAGFSGDFTDTGATRDSAIFFGFLLAAFVVRRRLR